ncbi:MAG: hypothetical protein ABI863_00520 [Ginsengibacter sp.]
MTADNFAKSNGKETMVATALIIFIKRNKEYMEIATVSSSLEYYDKIRMRMNKLLLVLPHNKLDWTNMPGKFSISDQVELYRGN